MSQTTLTNPLERIPTPRAIRRRLAELEEQIRRYRILLRVATELESSGEEATS